MTYLKLSRKNTQFLMIDLQERLLPAIHGFEEIKTNALRLVEGAKVLEVPFTYTEQYPKGLGSTDRQLLEKIEGKTAFQKLTFSCCDEEGFIDILEKNDKKQIVLWGIEIHICVLATVMDLIKAGFTVWVAADACGSRNRNNHDLVLRTMTQMGAIVVPTETVLYQLMGRSGTPEFKTLLPLFK
ncbi:hydrolase [Aminobacterium sp. EBM-42]|uniref:hydrolase n=1 Tax=Aminobacterium sp. EBM-42 TaxID=1918503 RepID=UPI00257DE86B|nr:hydrolase [Aminobacterium sp. EBM-42]